MEQLKLEDVASYIKDLITKANINDDEMNEYLLKDLQEIFQESFLLFLFCFKSILDTNKLVSEIWKIIEPKPEINEDDDYAELMNSIENDEKNISESKEYGEKHAKNRFF